ncbi:hypothetical protein ACFX12_031140 [Malus domestica]
MENGECSYGVPKLKRRTVSAVRDFPRACGRFGQLRVDEELLLGEVLTRALKWSCGWADLMNGKDVGTVEPLISGGTNDDEQGIETRMVSTGSVKMFKIKSFTRVKVEGIFL